jgi:hypothetical protein
MAMKTEVVLRRRVGEGFYRRCRLEGDRLGVVAPIEEMAERVTQELRRDEGVVSAGTWVRRCLSSRREVVRT